MWKAKRRVRNKTSRFTILLRALALALTIGLAGCGGGVSATAVLPDTPTPPAEPVAESTLEPELLPGPAASIPTPETITTAQLAQRLNPFADPQCALPCFNGLTPAAGDFYAALSFYSQLGISSADMVPGDYENTLDGTGHLAASLLRASDVQQAVAAGYRPPRIDIALESGVVSNIFVNWSDYPPAMTLPIILGQLGPPDDLKIGLMFETDPPTFLIQMIYTGRQSGFLFRGTAESAGQALSVCPDAAHITGSALGIYGQGVVPLAGIDAANRLLPMEQSTGIAADQFAALAQASSCLTITADRWAQWQAPTP